MSGYFFFFFFGLGFNASQGVAAVGPSRALEWLLGATSCKLVEWIVLDKRIA